MKKFNICTGLGVLALAVLSYLQTLGMIAKVNTDALGPAFFPKWLSIVLGVLAILLILQGVLSKSNAPAPIDFRSEGFVRVMKVSLVLVAFSVIVYVLGMYVGIVFMLPACMWLHGEHNRKTLLLITVGTCAFIFLVFGLVLRVPLPSGILFS